MTEAVVQSAGNTSTAPDTSPSDCSGAPMMDTTTVLESLRTSSIRSSEKSVPISSSWM